MPTHALPNSGKPLTARHSETEESYLLDNGWAWRVSEPEPPVLSPPLPAKNVVWPAAGTYWRHFKGGLYLVHGGAIDFYTLNPLVVYESLRGTGGLWVRPLAMWGEVILRDDYAGPRFRPVENL